jgi:hypothetical protein
VRESSPGLVKKINTQFKVLEKLIESHQKKKQKKIEYLDINNCYSTKYADSILRKTTSNLIIINYYFNIYLITTIRLNDYYMVII